MQFVPSYMRLFLFLYLTIITVVEQYERDKSIKILRIKNA